MEDSLTEITKKIFADLQDLLRAELALASAELTKNLSRVANASAYLIAGIVLAFAGLLILLLGIAATLAIWLPLWSSLLIIGAVVLLISASAVRRGATNLSKANAAPERTIANLKKDAAVIAEHI